QLRQTALVESFAETDLNLSHLAGLRLFIEQSLRLRQQRNVALPISFAELDEAQHDQSLRLFRKIAQLAPKPRRLLIVLRRFREHILRQVTAPNLRVGTCHVGFVIQTLPKQQGLLRSLQSNDMILVILRITQREESLRLTASVAGLLAQHQRLVECFFGLLSLLTQQVAFAKSI